MKEKIGLILKRIVFSFGIIYGINILLDSVDIYIPINFATISISSFLGVPGIISLFALLFIIK